MARKERDIESFSKEVLIAFIKSNIFFWNQDWAGKMTQLEAQLRHDKLRAEVDDRIARMGELKGPANFPEWRKNSDRIDACWQEMDRLQPILFPHLKEHLKLRPTDIKSTVDG